MPYVGKSMDRKRNARRRQLSGAHTAESWNAAYPVGTAVRYWPIYPPSEGFPPEDTTTRSEASALAGLVDALPVCLVNDCGRPATLGHLGPMPDVCEAHRDDIEYQNRLKRNDKADAIEAAERALGRRR